MKWRWLAVALSLVFSGAVLGEEMLSNDGVSPASLVQQINQKCRQENESYKLSSDVADCIMKAAQHYSSILQDEFDKLAKSTRNEDVLKLLKESQISWDAFRRSACIFQVMTLFPGDNIKGKPSMASCMLYITIDRLANLQYIASNSK